MHNNQVKITFIFKKQQQNKEQNNKIYANDVYNIEIKALFLLLRYSFHMIIKKKVNFHIYI